MHVLSDTEIKTLLAGNPSVIQDFPDNPGWRTRNFSDPLWDGKDSPIQPCSIDLHIGEIFVPGTPDGHLGSPANGCFSYELDAGHSVVVMSHETLNLPNNIGAIALPPSRISSAGIFIANFGHIDPGYSGHLRFTLINMGRESFPLKRGEMAITLILFEVGPALAPFGARYSQIPDRPTKQQVDCLARDFANITERAKEIARKEIDGSGLDRMIDTTIKPAIYGAIFGIIASVLGYMITIKVDIGQDVKKIGTLEERLADLQKQVSDIKSADEPNKSLAVQIKGLEGQVKHMADDLSKIKTR